MESFRLQFNTGYRNPDTQQLDLSPSQSSLIVAILSLGCIFGALLSAPVADFCGRRKGLIIAIAVFNLGVVLQVAATNIPTLLAGRYFAGMGVGAVSLLIPLYLSETAPKYCRGTMVCAYQLFITLGLLSASAINMITQKLTTSAAYRIPMGLQLTWAFVLSLGLCILPETPRYLVKRGLRDSAALSLSRLRRLDITHPALLEELAEIEANHEYELALGGDTYKDIFVGQPRLGLRTLTGCGLQMLQQLTGVNFIMYYSTTFFQGAGVPDAFLISLIINIVNVFSTIPGVLVIESWGRRKLLMVGAIGMAVSQLLIASFTTAAPVSLQITSNQISVGVAAVYICFFASSWGPTVWVISSEIYPLKVRAKCMSVSTASNWLFNFAIAYGTPYMVGEGPGNADLGPKIFFIWGAACVVAVVFVYFMVFETSGVSLEQVDELYERVQHAWNSKGFEPSWSFQQLRDLGYSDSGIPPQDLELEHSSTTQSSHTGGTGTTTSASDNKMLATMGNVDFSY